MHAHPGPACTPWTRGITPFHKAHADQDHPQLHSRYTPQLAGAGAAAADAAVKALRCSGVASWAAWEVLDGFAGSPGWPGPQQQPGEALSPFLMVFGDEQHSACLAGVWCQMPPGQGLRHVAGAMCGSTACHSPHAGPPMPQRLRLRRCCHALLPLHAHGPCARAAAARGGSH
jgi:hypothetical protein